MARGETKQTWDQGEVDALRAAAGRIEEDKRRVREEMRDLTKRKLEELDRGLSAAVVSLWEQGMPKSQIAEKGLGIARSSNVVVDRHIRRLGEDPGTIKAVRRDPKSDVWIKFTPGAEGRMAGLHGIDPFLPLIGIKDFELCLMWRGEVEGVGIEWSVLDSIGHRTLVSDMTLGDASRLTAEAIGSTAPKVRALLDEAIEKKWYVSVAGDGYVTEVEG